MYTLEQLDQVNEWFKEQAWLVVKRHLLEEIQSFNEQLIEANNDELRGRIKALRNDVLTLPEWFNTALKESRKEREETEKQGVSKIDLAVNS